MARGIDLLPDHYIEGQPVPTESIDWDIAPFLPSQAQAVNDCLRAVAERWGWDAVGVDKIVSRAWTQVLEAARKAEIGMRLQHIDSVTRKRCRFAESISILIKKPVPGAKVPKDLRDAVRYGAWLARVGGKRVTRLAPEQVKVSAVTVKADPTLSGERGRPEDLATRDYIRNLNTIYHSITQKRPICWYTGKPPRPCGPYYRLLRACLSPLRPDIGPHGIVKLLRACSPAPDK